MVLFVKLTVTAAKCFGLGISPLRVVVQLSLKFLSVLMAAPGMQAAMRQEEAEAAPDPGHAGVPPAHHAAAQLQQQRRQWQAQQLFCQP
jgi:hypothetical protein